MEAVNFDKLWAEVGEMGRYQVSLYAMLMIVASYMSSWISFRNIFILYIPEHDCNGTMPNCAGGNISACDSWNFDQSVMESSAVTKFGLFCEFRYLAATALITTQAALSFTGSVLFGNLQDRFGRKPTMYILVTVYLITTIPTAWIDNFYVFVILRWIGHLGQVTSFNSGYLYGLEMTGATKRTAAGAAFCMMYAFGAMTLGLVAYLFNDLFSHILASSLPFLVMYVTWPVVLESPRWLMNQGRYDEAVDNLHTVARWNGRKLSRIEVERLVTKCQMQEEKTDRDKKIAKSAFEVIKLFRGPKMRNIVFMVVFAWISIHVTYTAIAYNVKNIGGNFFVVYALQAFVEVPAVLIDIPIINYFGRIWPMAITMILSGITGCLCALKDVVPDNVSIGLAILSKFLICMSFGVIYQLATELYPTEVRGLALGFTTLFAVVGSCVFPFIVESAGIYVFLPMVILGIICLIAGVVVLGLPETKYRPMLETLHQVEHDLPGVRAAFYENVHHILGKTHPGRMPQSAAS